jgi:WD40 repeat protein
MSVTLSSTVQSLRPPLGRILGVAWSGDGALLATPGTRGIGVWEPTSGKRLIFIPTEQPATAGLSFSPNGQRLAGVLDDCCVHLWDCQDGREIAIHSDAVFTGPASWSPSREVLAAVSPESIGIWESYSGSPQDSKPIGSEISCMAWSPDGEWLATAGASLSITLWRVSPLAVWRKLAGTSNVRSLAWSPDGKMLASGNEDGLMGLWNISGPRIEQVPLQGHGAVVSSVAFSPDGKHLVSKSADGTMRLWECGSATEAALVQEGAEAGLLPALAFQPESTRLASTDAQEGVVQIRDLAFQAPQVRPGPRPQRIFISYSHADLHLKEQLLEHLDPLRREGLIESWHDRAIPAGAAWAEEIDRELHSADIILLLLSASFVASEYCYGIETKAAMERHDRGVAEVIPVLLRDAAWEGCPFAKLQAIPQRRGSLRAVVNWARRDEALRTVALGIREVAERLRAKGR